MISDERRRQVANLLRRIVKYDASQTNLVYRESVEKAIGIFEVDESFCRAKDVCMLADFIDRPTCEMDCTESFESACGTVRVWECSNCGQECEEVNGSYEFCPHCGAEVARDGN